MSEPMTDAELGELQSLADAATPGPWEWIHKSNCEPEYGSLREPNGERIIDLRCNECDDSFVDLAENRAFIAASRTAVPRLIAEVRRLRDTLERLRPWVEDGDFCPLCEKHPGAKHERHVGDCPLRMEVPDAAQNG